jgi:carbamoyl-phosphate synthase large subunit
MIRKIHPKKVLILGSGALQIGQAGEFDYSGSQAIKALKEDDITTVLINPNIATIQTSEKFADKVYLLPITFHFVEDVIKKEKPDGILLGFGGQTALNVGVELFKKGVLKKYGIRVLGTPVESIVDTEDRDRFTIKTQEAGFKVPYSKIATNLDEALTAADEIGFPLMMRIAYALGGLGSGIVSSRKELTEKCGRAFSFTSQILIEESLYGWKEVEYEIVRDYHDNCITICSMENIDPMGIHTGDSIVVAPVQTLTANENFMLRSIGINLIRHLGIIGECNIQYALDPHSDDYRIIEVNARLSRSSALASKASGYPLAFIATKLALGYALNEIPNIITEVTSACFEPALDYIIVKFPRWDLQKFTQVIDDLGSEMKSVGEVMSIGRNFEEAFQKAVRMLDIGLEGLSADHMIFDNLDKSIKVPNDKRMFAISRALIDGYTLEKIHDLSKIDFWFLNKLKNIVDLGKKLRKKSFKTLDRYLLLKAKKFGFSDKQIAQFIKSDELKVRKLRKKNKIIPFVKQIDTLAAEYPALTNYLYITYHASEDDLTEKMKDQIIVLGSGPYRIGSSVEFDWCCVNSVITLNRLDYTTIMINCNPETVSTDYDICDKLYFEELSFERVMDIYEKENPQGLIVSMGGQVANNLAVKLHEQDVKILGTSPNQIDNAENRYKFSKILDQLKIDQPEWREFTDIKEANVFAAKVEYPVLIRPSYVLSGAAMNVVRSSSQLQAFLQEATEVNKEHPVVISKFITGARELEIDSVADEGEVVCHAITEHVENAGVHSGDATMVFPPQRTYIETMRRVKTIAREIARVLQITGPFNIQFIAKDNEIKVIECNLRASRSFPFISKVTKNNFIDIATRVIMKKKISKSQLSSFDLDYVGVKSPQFSFTRLKGSDPVLGVEMSSTGEVGCVGEDFEEAFLKSLISIGFKIPDKTILLSTGSLKDKDDFLQETRMLYEMGYKFYATGGTAKFLKNHDIITQILRWPLEKQEPNALTYIANGKIDLVINIPKNAEKTELTNGYLIRRAAVDHNVPLLTNPQLAKRFVKSLMTKREKDLKIKSIEEYI